MLKLPSKQGKLFCIVVVILMQERSAKSNQQAKRRRGIRWWICVMCGWGFHWSISTGILIAKWAENLRKNKKELIVKNIRFMKKW